MEERINVYVDQDDVLANFAKQHQIDLLANPAIQYPQAVYGFFANLKPLPNALESMRELEYMCFDVWILTRPSVYNTLCYTEKRVWIEQHLGLDWCHRLILCPDKGSVGTEKDYLVDDFDWKKPKDEELTPWKGTQYQFGQEGNKDWDEIMLKFRELAYEKYVEKQ